MTQQARGMLSSTTMAVVDSVNNNGQIIVTHPDYSFFIYEEATGSLQAIPIDPKAGGGKFISGVNDSAQITGQYNPVGGYSHGLFAAPQ